LTLIAAAARRRSGTGDQLPRVLDDQIGGDHALSISFSRVSNCG
jgi:hypothetical protein